MSPDTLEQRIREALGVMLRDRVLSDTMREWQDALNLPHYLAPDIARALEAVIGAVAQYIEPIEPEALLEVLLTEKPVLDAFVAALSEDK